MVRVPPFKPSKEGDPKLETFKDNLDSIVRFGIGEELRVSSTPLDAMEHQSPAKDLESAVANQSDLKGKTSKYPLLDLSFKDSVAGFDSLDLFWRTPNFVGYIEEPLDIYLRDSFNYVGSFRHVSVAAEPSVKESESVVSEPFVSDSSISCHTEVNMRDDHQKHKGEKAKKKTLNDEIVSLSSCRRAEEKKCDDEEDKEGVDKSVDDSLSTEEATMSKELASVPFVNIGSSVLDKKQQKNMATKRRSDETKTCSTSNKKNKNVLVSPRRLEAETWLSLPYPYHHYPIKYQIMQSSIQMQHSGIGTEPLVTFVGQNRLNQPIGGIVGLSEFPQVIQELYSLPNAPPLPNLNLQIHPQPHLGGRVRKEQP